MVGCKYKDYLVYKVKLREESDIRNNCNSNKNIGFRDLSAECIRKKKLRNFRDV